MKNTVQLHPDVDVRREVGRILNLLLADEYVLYKIMRDYHWNVTGPDYYALRLQFHLQQEEAARWVDDVSEWIRELHLEPRINWTDLIESARLSAASGLGLPAQRMIAELLRAHEEIMAQLCTDSDICLHYLGEVSMASLLTDLRERHENAAWMLRAHLGATWERNEPVTISA